LALEEGKTKLKLTILDDPSERMTLTTRLSSVTAEMEELSEKLEAYDPWRTHLRMILYIGSVMLFVGLLRVNIISEWHLFFIDADYKELLRDFFKYSLTAQAGFYTILLALMYFPVAYFIPNTPDAPNVQNSLQNKGFLATVNEFFPRLIVFILPLLAKPVANLFQYLFTTDAPLK